LTPNPHGYCLCPPWEITLGQPRSFRNCPEICAAKHPNTHATVFSSSVSLLYPEGYSDSRIAAYRNRRPWIQIRLQRIRGKAGSLCQSGGNTHGCMRRFIRHENTTDRWFDNIEDIWMAAAKTTQSWRHSRIRRLGIIIWFLSRNSESAKSPEGAGGE
jgi:hypothetical protein